MHVVDGQVGQRSAPVVFVLDPHQVSFARRRVGWQRQRAWIEVFSSELITYSRLVSLRPEKMRA